MYRELKPYGANQSLNTGGSRGADDFFLLPSYPKDFIPAKTIAEANAFAMNVLGVSRVEYKGCTVEVANEWNFGLSNSFKRFPELKKKFGFVGEVHEKNTLFELALVEEYVKILKKHKPDLNNPTAEIIARRQALVKMKSFAVSDKTMAQSCSANKGVAQRFCGVFVNRSYGKNLRHFLSALKQDVENNFRPVGCNTVRSVLDHEIGHQLDKLLGLRNMPEIQALFDSRVKIINGVEDYSQITKDLSRYAWENDNPNRYAEFIAEAWTEYCNNPLPREIAQKVGAIVEREYAKKYSRGV